MSFKKRETSAIMEKAKVRLAGMKEIDKIKAKLIDYGGDGNPITTDIVDKLVTKISDNIQNYNRILQQADELSNTIAADESRLKYLIAAVLSAAPAKFGEDANEIEKLGGTRKSDRKKSIKKPKTT